MIYFKTAIITLCPVINLTGLFFCSNLYMPNPKKGEGRKEFINRCMGDSESISTFPDEKQRYAFCESQFINAEMKILKLSGSVVNEETRLAYEKDGKECISLKKISDFINENKGQGLQFDISTLGGDLATALEIHDLISSYPKKTIGNVTGLLASAGTVILEACDERVMDDNKLFLIHNGWKEVTGNIYDFQKAVADMAKTDAIMVKIYKERTGLAEEKIIELMKASDWLTANEALEYGFIDRAVSSGMKIAASVVLQEAQGKINNNLLIKLEEKMKNPFKKDAGQAEKNYLLPLADGNNLLMNAEEAGQGVEVMPLGAMTLEDGEYELADGRKIVVAGGAITEVMEKPAEPEMSADQMVDTVAKMLTASEAKIEAMMEAKLKPLAALSSTHTPPKVNPVVNPGKIEIGDELQAKIEAQIAKNKADVAAKRKGV